MLFKKLKEKLGKQEASAYTDAKYIDGISFRIDMALDLGLFSFYGQNRGHKEFRGHLDTEFNRRLLNFYQINYREGDLQKKAKQIDGDGLILGETEKIDEEPYDIFYKILRQEKWEREDWDGKGMVIFETPKIAQKIARQLNSELEIPLLKIEYVEEKDIWRLLEFDMGYLFSGERNVANLKKGLGKLEGKLKKWGGRKVEQVGSASRFYINNPIELYKTPEQNEGQIPEKMEEKQNDR